VQEKSRCVHRDFCIDATHDGCVARQFSSHSARQSHEQRVLLHSIFAIDFATCFSILESVAFTQTRCVYCAAQTNEQQRLSTMHVQKSFAQSKVFHDKSARNIALKR
jgi:hypothetical protein